VLGEERLVGSLKTQVIFAKNPVKETIFCKRDVYLTLIFIFSVEIVLGLSIFFESVVGEESLGDGLLAHQYRLPKTHRMP